MAENIGSVTQVIGPVLDIRFEGDLPKIYNAVEIPLGDGIITAEVLQHIGNETVRCVSMNATDSLTRGARAVDTGKAISVPVGEAVLGRVC
ncbi:MAG: F0F1 ATP synthase subunit beta, partial [Oscillospiraceae bacterium]|nr:F0F1 ATP synthase subunit beta [Oscillospiraceae bacterium]